jgi:protein-disulfide isomerase
MSFAAIAEACLTKKGLALIAPALLLVGSTLAIGQSTLPPASAPPAAAPVEATSTPAPVPAVQPVQAESPKPAAPAASGLSSAQRKEVESIIKDYLINNPEVMIEVQNALEAKMDKLQSERVAAAIKSNASEIFRPAASPIVGNAKGDVTVIEFFDYNCGYCKRAFEPMAKLVEKDKQVKVIMKELPILSKGSEEAAGPSRRSERAAHRGETEPRHGTPEEGHGLAGCEQGNRRHTRTCPKAWHPGHASLLCGRSHHPRCA